MNSSVELQNKQYEAAARPNFIPWSRENIEQSIPEQFQRQVRLYGDRLAIDDRDRQLTYNELNCRSNQIAHQLLSCRQNIGAEPIALLFETGIEAIAAMLGVLKAGKFYVPLDVSLPESRLLMILEDSQAQLILSDRQNLNALKFDRSNLAPEILTIDNLDGFSPENPNIKVSPDDLAYIIYTSGSTGKPKGVMQNHRYVLNLCRNYTNSGKITSEDRFSLLYSAAFGGAVRDIYCALLNGAALFPLNVRQSGLHQLSQWLRDHEISVMFVVATLFRHFVATLNGKEQFSGLRLIQIGSETVYRQDAELFQQHFGKYASLMVNLGGTEISPVRQFLVNKDTVLSGNTIPAGYEVEGTEVRLWNEEEEEVAVGEVGEIVVTGCQVALGYWQNPLLTEKVFIQKGDRTYFKTGDLGKLLPDGCLLHLGRKDFQVKIRGYRVETTAVEAALLSLDSVREAVVVAFADSQGAIKELELIAYLTAVNSHQKPTTKELKLALETLLPNYMIPANFIWLESLPLTATGKVDRRALPEPTPMSSELEIEIVSPRNEIEATLVKIWSEVLNCETIGIENNFFDLGGNSLSASQMLARVVEQFSVNLPLKLIFEAPTISEFVLHLEESQLNSSPSDLAIASVKRPEQIPFALSQNRLWFLHQIEENKAVYNLFRTFRLSGRLNILALEQAIQALAERHEILRTTFEVVDDSPRQLIASTFPFKIKLVDLQACSEAEQKLKVETTITEAQNYIFDLTQLPLFKLTLIKCDTETYYLSLVMHHIISDDWSMQVFLKELSTLYKAICENAPSPLAPLPIQYADYAHWQYKSLNDLTQNSQVEYWLKQLADAPPILDLPTDFPRIANQPFNSGVVAISINQQLSEKIKQLAQLSNTTVFITLLTAFSVLLSRYSNQDDIIIGTGIANRQPVETEKLIGFFVSTLALRIKLSGNPNFTELLTQVHQTALDAYSHPDVPFDLLVEALQIKRHLSYHPLFQVMFILQNVPQQELSLPELSTQLQEVEQPTAGAIFDLTLSLKDTPQGLQGSFEYNSNLFQRETVQRMVTQLETLLEAIVEEPMQPVGFLNLLTAVEREKLLIKSQSLPISQTPQLSINQWFEEQVTKNPDAIALIFEQQRLTYQELNQKANQLAHYLQAFGIEPNTLVGICVERSLQMVIGILGILKAGGAYVPLDPTNPPERLNYILKDSQVKVLVTQSNLAAKVPQCEQILCLDRDWDKINQHSQENPELKIKPSNLAYVIYTSGSTGQPKGVLVSHENVVRLFSSTESWYHFSSQDIWTLFHSYAFDFSVWELWGGLFYGGSVVIVPYWIARDTEAFCQLLLAEKVTVLNQTPSAFYQLIQVAQNNSSLALRLVIFGGEALDLTKLKPWFEVHGDELPRLVNMYGITETTVHVTYRPLTKEDVYQTDSVIGEPIQDLQLYLLDRYQQPVPQGIRGEIYVGGQGVTQGYLNRPELTEERFITNPFIEREPDEKTPQLYKTGDIARYLASGELSYIGRIDDQVKLRGFRIELGEIEASLSQHPAIGESFVMVREDRPDRQQLTAYIVPDAQKASPILKMLQFKKQGRITEESLHELPNGMMVAHLNRTETDFLYREIYTAECYLQQGITINSGDCVFDVGANIGIFTLFAAHAAPDVEVYAFEPIPAVFEQLQLNTEIYNLKAKIFPLGLASETRSETFTYYPYVSVISGRFGSVEEETAVVKSYLLQQHAPDETTVELAENTVDDLLAERLESQQVTCQLTTLSQIIHQHQIEKIDLLKVDVEKSEQDVLKGICEEDWHKIKQLVIEVHDINGRLAEIKLLLEEHNYQVTVVRDSLLEATPLYSLYAKRPVVEKAVSIASDLDNTAVRAVYNSPNNLEKSLWQHLKQNLPEYMLPAALVFLPTLPLTANGKLDRQRLPAPNPSSTQKTEVLPQTELEKQIAEIWQLALGIEKVGIYDNFFELGGHSLLATQIISRLRSAFKVELQVRDIFESPTIAGLVAIINHQQSLASESIIPPIIPASEADKPDRLSFAQARLWFLDRLEAGSSATYNIAIALEITGRLNIAALKRGFREIIQRHAVLRTRIQIVDGTALPIIEPVTEFELEVVTNLDILPNLRQKYLQQQATTEAQHLFDLQQDWPIKIKLLQLTSEHHALFLTVHHIAADGWSLKLLLQELSTLYNAFIAGESSPVPPLPIQYVDYANWQHRWLTGEILEQQANFWQQQLADICSPLELPTDRPRPPVQTYRGNKFYFQLDTSLYQRLQILSQEANSSLFMTLLAALVILLSRYSDKQDILIGTPVANRHHDQTESLIGFFANTIVLKTRTEGNPSFRELLQQVRQFALSAYSNRDIPFEKVVEMLQPQRSLSHTPLFQVMFDLEPKPDYGEFSNLKLLSIDREHKTAKFDLTLSMVDCPEGFGGYWEYNSDLFDRETIARMASHFQTLLSAIAAYPEAKIEQLPLLEPKERHKLLVDWNQTQTKPLAQSVCQLFQQQARQTPDAIALQHEERSLTYRELDEQSTQLASYLQQLGVTAETLVGICIERSLEMVVGLWGILKAGGAYVPLDPAYPQERITYILQDTQLAIVLTQGRFQARFHNLEVRSLPIDTDWEAISQAPIVPPREPNPDDLAYVIYTSGSTGKPKGVEICHRSLANFSQSAIANYEIVPQDRVLQFASISFDAAAEEIYPCLCCGGTLVLRTDGMLASSQQFWQRCQDWHITVADLPTAYWHLLMAEPTASSMLPNQLRLVIIGGERAMPGAIKQWQDFVTQLPTPPKLINTYGPTEATVVTTFYPLDKGNDAAKDIHSLAIGKPLNNIQIYVLNHQMQPVPIGVPGELYIGGAGLARGYLNRPELTAEKFVPNPFRQNLARETEQFQVSERLYKTGDLVRYRSDGNLEFIGRLDNQIKLRGFRLELGEIEAILHQQENIQEAVVVVHQTDSGDKCLIGYVVPMVTIEIERFTEKIKAKLREILPEYMVPAAIVPLESLPTTVSGKIDRHALPAPPEPQRVSSENGLPQTAVERKIVEIWESLLPVKAVARSENFFDLGGTSLLLIRVCEQLRCHLEVELSIVEMFQHPTVSSLAAHISHRQQDGQFPTLIRQRRENNTRSKQQRQKRKQHRQGRNL